MKKIVVLVSIIIIVLTAFSPAEARPYKIGMTQWIGSSPLSVADAKGFWKELGLDVSVMVYTSDTDCKSAFKFKKIDTINDMLGNFTGAFLEGDALKIVCATDWSNGGDKVIIKKDLDLAKLKGEKIGLYVSTPAVTFFLNKYLAANSSKLADWQIVELDTTDLAKQFIAGKLKFTVNYDPQAITQEKEGNGKIVATSADFAGCIPEGFAFREDVLKEIPREDVVKILKGVIKAIEWLKDEKNLTEFTKIANEKTFAGEKYTEADIKGMLATVKFHGRAELADIHKADGSTVKFLSELNTFMKENKLSAKEFKPEEIFDPSYITEALK